MRFLTFRKNQNALSEVGILSEDGQSVIPVKDFGLGFSSMNELISGMTAEEYGLIKEQLKDKTGFRLSEVIKMAPIPEPRQDIICLGMNYSAHAREFGDYNKDYKENIPKAIYFSKRVNLAIPDGGSVSAHSDLVKKLDYEVELAVILGRDAKNVTPENAFDYIFGYSIINDFTARDLQEQHKQWYFGKSLDGFTAFGPWIVTKDEIPDAEKLDIKCWVNNELRQNSNTSMLIHRIGEIMSELSSGMTLKAGTIIATGTPAGVGIGFTPPKFLVPGDVVKCEIEGIGSITNYITD